MAESNVAADKKPVKLILVHLAEMTADLLRGALEDSDEILVIGAVSSAAELEGVLSKTLPDVALVGAGTKQDHAATVLLLERCSAAFPAMRQIVFAPTMDHDDVVAYFRAGARGLICSSTTRLTLLIKAVRCVAMGQIWANSEQLDQLVRSLSVPRSIHLVNQRGDAILSKREEQVLHLLADGLSNRELAKALSLSEHTVKNHLFRIFDKLGVSSRIEAVLYAVSQREQRLAAGHGTATVAIAEAANDHKMRARVALPAKPHSKYA